MKRIMAIVFVGVFLSSGVSLAVPLYYTFEGQIIEINDHVGIIADAGLEVGDAVKYVFLVDYDRQGELTRNNGTVRTTTDSAEVDYFYADFISGSLIEEKGGGYWNGPFDYTERNYGYDEYTGNNLGFMVGESADESTWVNALIGPVSSWEVGDMITGYEHAYGTTTINSYRYSSFNSSLEITSISPTFQPIPEPTTMLLLGTGLIGLAGTRRTMKS